MPTSSTSSTARQLTGLLENDLIARLEKLRIASLRKATSRGRGEHLSGRGGLSTDFADYRDYAPGDDMRFVDWNIFGRLQRPYLKLFRLEEERHVVIVIDASASMRFEDKLARARQLAAAFAVMGLYASDKVSVWVAGGGGEARRLEPVRGRASLRRAFAAIESVAVAAGAAPIDAAIDTVLKRHRGRGIIVVLSDFLTEGDLRHTLNRLFATALEPILMQILGPTELDPDVAGDVRFVDCETEQVLDVSAVGDLMTLYREHRLQFQRSLADWCAQRQGRFCTVNSDESVMQTVTEILLRKGWVNRSGS